MVDAWASGKRLLLMGSSAYKGEGLPEEVAEVLDEALGHGVTVIVGEARAARWSWNALHAPRASPTMTVTP
ncbi:hypothetical protein ES703_87018 [subsurface metagenome]